MILTSILSQEELIEIIKGRCALQAGLMPSDVVFHSNGDGVTATVSFTGSSRSSDAGQSSTYKNPVNMHDVKQCVDAIPEGIPFTVAMIRERLESIIGRKLNSYETGNLGSRLLNLAQTKRYIAFHERAGSGQGRNTYVRQHS